MRRQTLLIAASASLLTLGCGGSDTPSSEQSSAGTGGSSASVSGSGGGDGSGGNDGSGGAAPIAMGCDATAPATTLISCVESYTPGPGAGHGQDRFPEVVYGPPLGAGDHGGSTDVLSLGTGGVIVIGFGGNAVVDGEGADFIVFENAFLAGTKPFKELAQISVSEDGATWTAFPCKQDALPYDGCAGWHPVFSNPSNTISPTDPAAAGGDVFDLATIGVKKARFIKIVDLGNIVGTAGTTGFDLDAVAVLHAAVP
ncbi:MAG: hypothetical protein ACMG6S_09715 [Byssovorax sp.]